MNSIVKEELISFKEFEKKIYRYIVIRQIKRCPVLHIILHHIPHVEDTSVTFQSPVLSVYFKKGSSAAN